MAKGGGDKGGDKGDGRSVADLQDTRQSTPSHGSRAHPSEDGKTIHHTNFDERGRTSWDEDVRTGKPSKSHDKDVKKK